VLLANASRRVAEVVKEGDEIRTDEDTEVTPLEVVVSITEPRRMAAARRVTNTRPVRDMTLDKSFSIDVYFLILRCRSEKGFHCPLSFHIPSGAHRLLMRLRGDGVFEF
jgi:hypothetical protein